MSIRLSLTLLTVALLPGLALANPWKTMVGHEYPSTSFDRTRIVAEVVSDGDDLQTAAQDWYEDYYNGYDDDVYIHGAYHAPVAVTAAPAAVVIHKDNHHRVAELEAALARDVAARKALQAEVRELRAEHLKYEMMLQKEIRERELVKYQEITPPAPPVPPFHSVKTSR
ncbi:hypothetical protein Pan97_24940 [Bremerella volcania]|uniref:Uncharacterized protein n=1 Tax=Bremerella volcania TaxID=2527984 RepID=A0A518C8C9_9BACT|nr:hypothetical protein [Bremerella volcania]QDU75462.1 hypothetical protein Pan97_24940 [Bremerella volcania]